MWPFTRRPSKRPPLTEDWRVGDLAKCVRDDWIAAPPGAPRIGTRLIVAGVDPGHSGGKLGWCLRLVGRPGRWDATAFRKVRPARREDELARARELIF